MVALFGSTWSKMEFLFNSRCATFQTPIKSLTIQEEGCLAGVDSYFAGASLNQSCFSNIPLDKMHQNNKKDLGNSELVTQEV